MADSEVNLIREYENIIRTMKEQISVLKSKVSPGLSRAGSAIGYEEMQRKEEQIRTYNQQITDLSIEVDTLTESNRKLASELKAYEYGINQATQMTRSQMQERLL